MKIKQTRQVRLDELLKLFWNDGIKEGEYSMNDFGSICLEKNRIIFDNRNHAHKTDLFTITEEVEITEETPLNLVVVDDENEVTDENETKISSLKRDAETWGYEIKFIYLQNDDGSIGELIWKDGELVD